VFWSAYDGRDHVAQRGGPSKRSISAAITSTPRMSVSRLAADVLEPLLRLTVR
jgi:hypothetical protein